MGQIPAHLMPPTTLPKFGSAQPKPSARPTSNVTQPVCGQPSQQTQLYAAPPPLANPVATPQPQSTLTPPGIALPIGASLSNAAVSTPAQPAYGNQVLNPPLGTALATPAVPAGPWTFTRQAYRGAQTPGVGVDVNTIPISAGGQCSIRSCYPYASTQSTAVGERVRCRDLRSPNASSSPSNAGCGRTRASTHYARRAY